jgi:hypothetical protein
MKIKSSTWHLYSWIMCCICPPFGILYFIRPNWWNKTEQIIFFGVVLLVGLSGLLKILGIIEVTDSKAGQNKKEK